jgi:26S proteasome regulatory subunit N5
MMNIEESKEMEGIDQTKVGEEVAHLMELAKSGSVVQATEGLLAIEKKGRLAEDPTSTKLACCSLLEVLYNQKNYKDMQEKLVLLTKRRGQLKDVVRAMVRQCMEYVEDTDMESALDRGTKEEIIRTLQSITEGKIYVEIERARITRQLAGMKEEDGDIDEAANILQEVAVETFGSMAKVEKIAYILEQVRLCLEKKDYIRAQILSRKVSPKAFMIRSVAKKGESSGEIGIEGTSIEPPAKGTPSLEELKIQYYSLMIRYYLHEKDYLEVCRSYRAILDTPQIASNASEWENALKHAAWYSVLAPRDSDQITLLDATRKDSRMDSLPLYKSLLDQFSKDEILWWNIISQEFADEIESQRDIFGAQEEDGCRQAWRLRVIEHNIYTISKFYSKISLNRLADILELSQDEAEKRICAMVTERGLSVKIDRSSGTIKFGSTPSKSEILNAWSTKIQKVLTLLESTCQQIQKESQIHKVPIEI